MNKIRLDTALFEEKRCESREKAHALIMAGCVYVDNQKADKPGQFLRGGEQIEIRGNTQPYVSRGGLKLEKAVSLWRIDLTGKICCDIGASTGGFTDCMLQNGAAKVYAVDVGYGQLAWKLRTDPRVVNLERRNFRYVTETQIPEKIGFASVDVSFISIALILPVFNQLSAEDATAVCLLKPQFEAGREKVGKKGVVRDPHVHREVIEKSCGFAFENGCSVLGLTYSPIKGPEGNIEYLLYITKRACQNIFDMEAVVSEAHEILR